ncbi:MAG: hypothetical protein RIA38_01640 [Microcella pacifica]|uniref:hypothetical protein n=1 Tax=Microcella pacifica TaxID=2591847 RepID=UPI003316172D
MIDLPGAISGMRCSRSGCRAAAEWAVNWRNPRIHGVDRVKVWLACDEHRDYLYDYVDARGFPVTLTPAGTVVESLPDRDGPRDQEE